MWQPAPNRRNRIAAALALLATLTLPHGAMAQPPSADSPSPVTAETRIEPRSTTIGDPLTYTIAVTHDPDIKITPPDPLTHFEQFEYLDQGATTQQQADGRVTEEFTFKFRAMEVGYYNIAETPVHFTAPHPDDASKTVPNRIMAPKAVVEVRSVLFKDGEPEDIRDIKPIVGAGPPWRRYALYALGGLAALMVLYFLVRKIPKKRPLPPAESQPVLRAPHEVALEELDALEARQLIQQERLREHHFMLSEIFRRYLGALYGVPALDWTTEEIMENLLLRKRFPDELGRRALEILHSTDWVKFANAEPDAETCIGNVQAVHRFVEATLPRRDLAASQKSPSAAM
ncbi:hypothetical protein [Nitrospina watsonii]|uniref:Protein BatD n=1 Tax=Nitrospina watsonii TaxID=1323948 RepID=A0ABM9HD71_9BACT|nr:hypothetical protein [Nitrospina watsonii]CAI2718175.1 conserved exported protein of unknown function [Nitrospina watsonii]